MQNLKNRKDAGIVEERGSIYYDSSYSKGKLFYTSPHLRISLSVFCLLVTGYWVLFFLGCKGKTKEEKPKKIKAEDLSKQRAYVVVSTTDKDWIYIIDLNKNSIARKLLCPGGVRNIFLSEGNIWVAADSLLRVIDYNIKGVMELPKDYKGVLKKDNATYILRDNEISEFPGGKRLTLLDTVVKFIVRFGRIWVMDSEGISIYRAESRTGSNFIEEYRIPAESPLNFVLNPYGLRLYIMKPACLDVFDTESGAYITTIPINETPTDIEFVGDKIYCLTHSCLYVIKSETNRIEKKIKVRDGEWMWSSRDGSYGGVVRDSIISFFETEEDKIVKNLKLKVIDIATSLGDSRVYCLTTEGLIVIDANKFEPIGMIKFNDGKRVVVQ